MSGAGGSRARPAGTLCLQRTLTRVRLASAKFKWSWRESNPRPHKETIRFLHAYPRLNFRVPARPGPPTDTLSPKFHRHIGACADYFRLFLRRLIFGFGTRSSERRLVLLPCKRIKLIIYCASIKQREHTYCCQLNFRPNGLWRLQSSLRVLTYHLILPSNPVNPNVFN